VESASEQKEKTAMTDYPLLLRRLQALTDGVPHRTANLANASALLFSLLGGVLAMAVMALLRKSRRLSVYGVSIAGAAGHNTGQICAAMITLGNTMVLGYLPFLLLVSLFSGALTGFVVALLFRAMEHVNLSHS
jgi:uncharacterized membrane protein